MNLPTSQPNGPNLKREIDSSGPSELPRWKGFRLRGQIDPQVIIDGRLLQVRYQVVLPAAFRQLVPSEKFGALSSVFQII